MRKRNVFVGTVENLCHKYKDAINYIVIGLSIIGLFVGGYFIGANCYSNKHLTENEFTTYEQIAQTIYDKGTGQLIEVPEGITYRVKNGTIIVESPSGYFDNVTAKPEDGELVFTRNESVGTRIILNILFGIITVSIVCLFVALVEDSYRKAKSENADK